MTEPETRQQVIRPTFSDVDEAEDLLTSTVLAIRNNRREHYLIGEEMRSELRSSLRGSTSDTDINNIWAMPTSNWEAFNGGWTLGKLSDADPGDVANLLGSLSTTPLMEDKALWVTKLDASLRPLMEEARQFAADHYTLTTTRSAVGLAYGKYAMGTDLDLLNRCLVETGTATGWMDRIGRRHGSLTFNLFQEVNAHHQTLEPEPFDPAVIGSRNPYYTWVLLGAHQTPLSPLLLKDQTLAYSASDAKANRPRPYVKVVLPALLAGVRKQEIRRAMEVVAAIDAKLVNPNPGNYFSYRDREQQLDRLWPQIVKEHDLAQFSY